jgi:hypothetical protein
LSRFLKAIARFLLLPGDAHGDDMLGQVAFTLIDGRPPGDRENTAT